MHNEDESEEETNPISFLEKLGEFDECSNESSNFEESDEDQSDSDLIDNKLKHVDEILLCRDYLQILER